MDIPNTFYRTSIKAFIENELGKILLIQEDNGKWELPGGGIDFGEEPSDCLCREILEEMGIQISHIDNRPFTFFTWYENNKWRSNVVYSVKLENLEFKKSQECQEIGFFSISEAKKLDLFPNVEKFLDILEKSNK